MVAKVWDPVVTAREIALVQAYGARYDSNPNFEMWSTPETSVAVTDGYKGFTQAGYLAQLQLWMPAARTAFPTTGIRISANFLGDVTQMQVLIADAAPHAIGMGGPDTYPSLVTFAGTSNLVFNGESGAPDYRGVLPWISEVQQPDESGRHGTISQVYDFAMSGDPAKGGSMNPNYFLWALDASYQGPGAFTNGQIQAFIDSIGGTINTVRPSAY
jgi:hypothetical protein